MNTKEDFHKLIDKIKDEEVLKGYFHLIQQLNNSETGRLWKSLSTEEKEELLISYEESKNSENLIDHAKVKIRHQKWLKQ